MEREKFLPIGSVVLLNGGTKKLMITGFCSEANDNKGKVYDYSACTYPEGFLTNNQIILFNHDDINQLIYIGYEDDEEIKFKDNLKTYLSQTSN